MRDADFLVNEFDRVHCCEGREESLMRSATHASDIATEDGLGLRWLRDALGLDDGQSPFPWQVELLRRFREKEPVSTLDIPIGLGKTATMAVWLVARALGASLPR